MTDIIDVPSQSSTDIMPAATVSQTLVIHGEVDEETFRDIVATDVFGLFSLDASDELIVRKLRLVGLLEQIVQKTAQRNPKTRSQHANAKKNNGTFRVPDLHVADLFTYRLVADYSADGVKYEMRRVGQFKTGNEGFIVDQQGTETVVIRRLELDSSLSGDDRYSQEQLFDYVERFMRSFAENFYEVKLSDISLVSGEPEST